jgi:hypothetical protein
VRRTLIRSLCAAAVAALALPALASAQIQVDKGIAGARLGNTTAQVHAALGAPSRRQTGRNDFGRFVQETYAGGIVVFYQGARTVTSVTTTGLGDRTAKGVGVGSTEQAVSVNVNGVRCETISGSRSCHTHDFVPGRRVTDFFIRSGKVTRVSLGFVID